MGKVLLFCFLLLNGGFASAQLLGTVRNVRLLDPIPYMLKVIETAMKDMEEYGWCNLSLPVFSVDVNENVFDQHIRGKVTFSNAFVQSIQKVDVIQHTVQQIWRFNNADNTTSVFVQATVRMLDLALGYDVHLEMEDGSHHYFTGLFKHNMVEYPFAVIFNMFTEEFSALVTRNNLPINRNRMVFAPANSISQVLSHQYDYTSAAAGMAEWGSNVFEPILLNVAKHKVPFPDKCYNCPI